MADSSGARRRYEFKAVLGEGGFGTVYLARDLSSGALGSWVALKRLRPEAGKVDEVRFQNEAQLMAKLDNPAFVKVRALVRIEGRWSIEMDYVKGATFGQLIKELPSIPPLAALEIIRQVAQALYVAYESPGEHGTPLHVLHRDIKPSNLIIQRWGVVRVLDFGIARFEGDDYSNNTGTHLPGSGGYLAPERWGLIADFGHAADVFAVGVVLFELITQERFLDTRRLDMVEQPDNQVFAELLERRLAVLAATPGVPSGVVELVRAMLAYEAADRPTAGELERLCDQLIAQLGGRDVWRRWTSTTLHPLLDSIGEPEHTDGMCGRRWSSDEIVAVTSTGEDPAESRPQSPPYLRSRPPQSLGGGTGPSGPRTPSGPTDQGAASTYLPGDEPPPSTAWVKWLVVLVANGVLMGGLFALYRDEDGDGRARMLTYGDCDDTDPERFQGNPERCDQKDNNCDGQVDEDARDRRTWYLDRDHDGVGSTADPVLACAQPKDALPTPGDCADSDPRVKPGMPELCNQIDDDCDGTVDEGLPTVAMTVDQDRDGYGGAPAEARCAPPAPGFSTTGGDCDDGDPAVHPGADDPSSTPVDEDCSGTAPSGGGGARPATLARGNIDAGLSVQLQGPGGKGGALGARLSPGAWRVAVSQNGASPEIWATVTLASGETLTLDCQARFQRCTTR